MCKLNAGAMALSLALAACSVDSNSSKRRSAKPTSADADQNGEIENENGEDSMAPTATAESGDGGLDKSVAASGLGNNAAKSDSDPVNGTDDDLKVTLFDLVAASQEGKSVQACFSHDSKKMDALVSSGKIKHAHNCNRAVFNTILSGVNTGEIDLNNSDGAAPSFPANGGGGLVFKSGPSVMGGIFDGKWIKGIFDVEIQCALSGGCHDEVTFLSVIGEVITKTGETMWLQIDQGVIFPNKKYSYDFHDFKLTNKKPTFGTYCELQ